QADEDDGIAEISIKPRQVEGFFVFRNIGRFKKLYHEVSEAINQKLYS
ncbi:uncharacterized protein METZ01_LOCUS337852, partial [marine metagenome]